MITVIKAKGGGEHQVINRLEPAEGRGERVVGEVWRYGGLWFAEIYDLKGACSHFKTFRAACEHARRMARPA